MADRPRREEGGSINRGPCKQIRIWCRAVELPFVRSPCVCACHWVGAGRVTGGLRPRPPTAAPPCGTRQAAPPRGVPAPAHRHPQRPRAHSDLCTVTKGGDGGTGNRVQTADDRQEPAGQESAVLSPAAWARLQGNPAGAAWPEPVGGAVPASPKTSPFQPSHECEPGSRRSPHSRWAEPRSISATWSPQDTGRQAAVTRRSLQDHWKG